MGATVRSLLPDYPIVEATYSGHVSKQDVDDAFGACAALGIEHDIWNLLGDCTDMVWTPTVTDLFELVQFLADMGVSERFREALVRPTDAAAVASVGFWETAGVNRGLNIRTFHDRESAIAWLAS
jgi:hypothetical protein